MISSTIIAVARAPIASFAAMGMIWGTFAAILPDLKLQLGVNEAELGLLMLATPLAAIAAMLVAPAIGAALGRIALPMAAVTMALSFMLPGHMATAWLFAPLMMCVGAATGLTDVLMNARVAALESERDLHLMNLCHAGYSFGYAAAALLTGVMREAGWPPGTVMTLMACLSLMTALLTFERDGQIEGLARPAAGTSAGLGAVPVIGGGIVLIAFLTENAAESWSALHIEKTLGGSPGEGAMGPAVLALTMGVARIAGQGLVIRMPAGRLLIGGAFVAATGAMIAATAFVPVMAYAGFIVMGIGASVIAPTAFSLVGRMAEPQARARAVARATLYGYLGFFVGPPLLGVLAGAFGLRAAFVCTAAVLMLVSVLVPMLIRRGA